MMGQPVSLPVQLSIGQFSSLTNNRDCFRTACSLLFEKLMNAHRLRIFDPRIVYLGKEALLFFHQEWQLCNVLLSIGDNAFQKNLVVSEHTLHRRSIK